MSKKNRPDRFQRERQKEAEANRRRYASWRDVLQEGDWIACGVCGKRQFVRGRLDRKRCRQCRAPLAKSAI
jgi:hypothetical protein